MSAGCIWGPAHSCHQAACHRFKGSRDKGHAPLVPLCSRSLGFWGSESQEKNVQWLDVTHAKQRHARMLQDATTHTVSFLQEAVTGDFGELVRLLLDHGGKIFDTRRGQV